MASVSTDLLSANDTSGHRLKRQLGLADLVLTQVLIVVGSSWVGVAAGVGPAQAVVWLFAISVFYLPMAVSVYSLNREMPLEGGLYVWARQAFGDAGGFMTAWNLYAYSLCVIAAILAAVPTEVAYMLGPSAAWLPESKPFSLALVVLLMLLLAAATVRGLALGKWIHNVGGAAMMLVFLLLIAMPVWAMLHHEPIHYAPFTLALPRANLYTLALISQIVVGALSGLEYVAITAGETRNPSRAIGLSVVIASPIICLMFILGTGAVVAFQNLHPGAGIDFTAPVPQTLRLALGHQGAGSLLAAIAILLLQLRLLGACSALFTGVTRLPMTAGWNHLVPEWFTRLHPRFRTPTNSTWVAAGVVLALLVLSRLGVHAAESFQTLQNTSIELYSIGYLAMFAIPLIGNAALRIRLPRLLLWTSVIGLLATAASFMLTAYPFIHVDNKAVYAAKILGTTVCANLVGWLFYRIRGRIITG